MYYIINDDNKDLITKFLSSIDDVAKKDPELVDGITTDDVLQALIQRTDKRMGEFLDLYLKNNEHVTNLTLENGPASEIEYLKENMKMESRDLFASYSLYKTYNELAKSRNIEVQITSNLVTVEIVLKDTGFIEKTKQL